MIGLSTLAARLTGLGNDEMVLWLESGLRTVSARDDAEGAELAFAPLLLSRAQPPMQQFHAAVGCLPGAVQARLRWSCGRLLDSLRLQDEPAYQTSVWSLAVAFKPPLGVTAAARRLLAGLPTDPHELEFRRALTNAVISAVLSYPRSEEQDNFVAEFRRHPAWTAKYTEEYVLYLIEDNPSAWVDIVRSFNDASSPLPDARPGFFRRLAKAVGPGNLARGIAALNRRERLDWLRRKLQPYFGLRFSDTSLELLGAEGKTIFILHEAEFPTSISDDEAESLLTLIERPRPGDAALARDRLRTKLQHPRLDQIIRESAN